MKEKMTSAAAPADVETSAADEPAIAAAAETEKDAVVEPIMSQPDILVEQVAEAAAAKVRTSVTFSLPPCAAMSLRCHSSAPSSHQLCRVVLRMRPRRRTTAARSAGAKQGQRPTTSASAKCPPSLLTSTPSLEIRVTSELRR
jgi:hypothetical protein